jgi:hypothetical protein
VATSDGGDNASMVIGQSHRYDVLPSICSRSADADVSGIQKQAITNGEISVTKRANCDALWSLHDL